MKQTRVGVSIIIFNEDGHVLVGKRKGSHGKGLLQVPGGHIEFYETYKKTCDRELKEEIGTDLEAEYFPDVLNTDKYQKQGFSEDFFEREKTMMEKLSSLGLSSLTDDDTIRKHYTTLYFAIKVRNSTVITNCEPDKCEGWEWMNVNDLPIKGMFCDCYSQILQAHRNFIYKFYNKKEI